MVAGRGVVAVVVVGVVGAVGALSLPWLESLLACCLLSSVAAVV